MIGLYHSSVLGRISQDQSLDCGWEEHRDARRKRMGIIPENSASDSDRRALREGQACALHWPCDSERSDRAERKIVRKNGTGRIPLDHVLRSVVWAV